MRIEQFVAQSKGKWQSMRSAHTLAFKQFEEIISTITITPLEQSDPLVINLRDSYQKIQGSYISPFQIEWEAEGDWSIENTDEVKFGSTILIPIPEPHTATPLAARPSAIASPIARP